MSRISTPASIEAAPAASQASLNAVKAQLGSVPNLYRLLANSPAGLEGFLAFNGSLGKGSLDVKTRNRIALTVAEENGCDYCLSAHVYLAKALVKFTDEEIAANRNGASADAQANAALEFVVKLVRERGHVTKADVQKVKDAGYTDAQLVEIVLHVALNTATNYINEAFETDIDFPEVKAKNAA